jgi:hypothetical protein
MEARTDALQRRIARLTTSILSDSRAAPREALHQMAPRSPAGAAQSLDLSLELLLDGRMEALERKVATSLERQMAAQTQTLASVFTRAPGGAATPSISAVNGSNGKGAGATPTRYSSPAGALSLAWAGAGAHSPALELSARRAPVRLDAGSMVSTRGLAAVRASPPAGGGRESPVVAKDLTRSPSGEHTP